MIFEFTDSNNWKYQFIIDETDLLFVEVNTVDNEGKYIHRDYVPFSEEVFLWREYHLRNKDPLVSAEARKHCEKIVTSYMKMKAFW